jgi:hypothetical protein
MRAAIIFFLKSSRLPKRLSSPSNPATKSSNLSENPNSAAPPPIKPSIIIVWSAMAAHVKLT